MSTSARLDDLRGIETGDDSFRIGALTRHADLQSRDDMGLIAAAANQIADQQVRNRGTIGGSLANGDAAADLPAVLLAYGGSVVVQGAGGEREIAAEDLFEGYLTTSIASGEVLTHVRIPALAGYGWGYEKFNRRAEDWAMVGVCALVKKAADGTCEDVRVGLTHMASTPLRATVTEDALRGKPLDGDHIAVGRVVRGRRNRADGRPQRHAGLQEAPRAHPDDARAGNRCGRRIGG